MARNRLIIAGGGTGGHVLAGIAIADEWIATTGGDREDVLFVGASGGIEEKLVPRAGYRLELLSVGALNRVSVARKIKTLFQLPVSLFKSAWIVVSFRPKAVLGVGGYASGPLVLMARLKGFWWGVRTAILEQNTVPGLTNRILGRVTHRVFCAFPGTEKGFPKGKPIVTGNPVRSSMKTFPSASRDPFTIFVFGGSQGAAGINTLVLDALASLRDLLPKLRFIHQTGEKDFDRVAEGYRSAEATARVEKFIHDMPDAYAQASLLVCRSGSSTLAEVAAVGRAAILIPFPKASDNHQEKNARVFSDAGAAYLLLQERSTGAELARIFREAIADPANLARMEKVVTAFHRPSAAKDVVRGLLR